MIGGCKDGTWRKRDEFVVVHGVKMDSVFVPHPSDPALEVGTLHEDIYTKRAIRFADVVISYLAEQSLSDADAFKMLLEGYRRPK